MTLAQLREAVALLGFESSLDRMDENAGRHFLFCADRALWAAERLRPRIGLFRLHHDPAQNLLSAYAFRRLPGETLTLSADGARAYTFSVVGGGVCTVRDGGGERSFTISTAQNRRYSGVLGGGRCELVFSGNGECSLYECALWDRLPVADDVPVGTQTVDYDLSELCDDFLILDDPPFVTEPANARVENGRVVRLPRETSLDCEVRYRRSHERITADTPDDAPLPLDEDLCQAAVLLVAAYLCLDDAPDKSDFYLKLYADQCARISADAPPTASPTWKSTNNW